MDGPALSLFMWRTASRGPMRSLQTTVSNLLKLKCLKSEAPEGWQPGCLSLSGSPPERGPSLRESSHSVKSASPPSQRCCLVAIKLEPREDRHRDHRRTAAEGLRAQGPGPRTWEVGHLPTPCAKARAGKEGLVHTKQLPSKHPRLLLLVLRLVSLEQGSGSQSNPVQIYAASPPTLPCD